MFDDMMTDRVTVRKQDGESYADVAASVQSGKIISFRTDIPIRPGDQIVRSTPAGVEEVFEVVDPGFHQGFSGMPSSYQMKVRRADVPAAGQGHVIYNVTGSNARFNINSVDSSTNVVNQLPSELFQALRRTLETKLPSSPDREELLQRTQDLEAEIGKKSFGQRYAEFMALAANHMETVGPFIPALAQLLMRG